ncbi:MAG TPA: hypothetical protein VF883_24355 [Thermoanaerobaculia bacterium]|jgi:hypothetical protein
MKRTLFLLALVAGTLPVFAQNAGNEFGFIVSGSRRFVDSSNARSLVGEEDWIESNFEFGNTAYELYWSIPIEPDLNLVFKGGTIQSEIGVPIEAVDPDAEEPGTMATFRRDVADGAVHHAGAVVEYEFDEPFGSSGLFAGLGMYRLTAPGEDAQQTWGVHAGVNSDFPISRRYGVVLEAAYHWTKADFNQRFMTVGAGLRVSF